MKLTFNILNQALGEATNFDWFIDAMRYIGVKEEKHSVSGFVTWDLQNGYDVENVIEFNNTTAPIPDPLFSFQDIIAAICQESLTANPIEDEKHGKAVSKLENIQCYIKSDVDIMDDDSPYSVTELQGEEGEEPVEVTRALTWREWLGGNIQPVSANGFFFTPMIKDKKYIDMLQYITIYSSLGGNSLVGIKTLKDAQALEEDIL